MMRHSLAEQPGNTPLTQIDFPESARRIAMGEHLHHAGKSGSVWTLAKGVLRLSADSPAGRSFVHLAMPGDLIGVESLCTGAYGFTATAVVVSELTLSEVQQPTGHAQVLARALLQGQLRAKQAMELRAGSIADRVSRFLGLLEAATGHSPREMRQIEFPQLKDIALILNSTPESVCRALTQMMEEGENGSSQDSVSAADPKRSRPGRKPTRQQLFKGLPELAI